MTPPGRIVASAQEIARGVEACAQALVNRGVDARWVVVAILDGALPFAADLMRALARHGVHPSMDSLKLQSWGDARVSSGTVRVISPLARPVAGAPVLLVDDIYDSGRTLALARDLMLEAGASELAIAVAVSKQVPRAASVTIDAAALEMSEGFLIGYGMDDRGRWRGLPDIRCLDDATSA